MTRLTPSAASASAEPRPSPLLEAQTIAHLPEIPRSMLFPLLFQQVANEGDREVPLLGEGARVKAPHKPFRRSERSLQPQHDILDNLGRDRKLAIGKKLDDERLEERIVRL